MRRVLVTGGGGFIGSHLAETLVRDGVEVRVLDDFSSGRPENLSGFRDRLELLEGDVRDHELLGRATEGVEVVFHEAAVPSVPRSVAEPLRTNDVNVNGTLGLLEAAREAGVRRLVFAASSSAYGDTPVLPKVETMVPTPLSPYALQKLAGEQYCRLYTDLYGLETVALRYFNVYGPRQNPQSEYAAVIPKFVTACLDGIAPIIYGDGEQTRDFTYVADVVRANLLAASAPGAAGQVINVAGGGRISLNQLLGHIRELCGASAEASYHPARAGDVRDSQADLSRARSVLGFEPTTPIEEGLESTIDHFRKLQSEGKDA
ncbi:MAG: LPS biosynthesis protein WbpP [Deltaproteobacteria bacterium]|nr:LPS biosynthesis protein WbpP [Deltaproteobacteria bacterium]